MYIATIIIGNTIVFILSSLILVKGYRNKNNKSIKTTEASKYSGFNTSVSLLTFMCGIERTTETKYNNKRKIDGNSNVFFFL